MAGVVISPADLQFVPICRTRTKRSTNDVMSDLEKTGLLKMDWAQLSRSSKTACSIERETGSRLDLARIPLDDERCGSLPMDC
jgi:DNA polymerase III alpha subunit